MRERAKGQDLIERGYSDLHKRWARSRSPLRPIAEVVASIEALIAPHPGPCLLLGVTPELATMGQPLVAIDWSAAMIEQVWPGNAPGRTVVQADWMDMPFASGSFATAIGDGVLNMLHWPDDYGRIVARLGEALSPGGRIVMRCFTCPDEPDDLACIEGQLPNGFHAFKWKLAMAVAQAAGDANVAMRDVWLSFERLFPDREHLSRATGWSLAVIAEIDDYQHSPHVKSFPTRAQLLAMFPKARLVESGHYELAERCPLLVMDT